MAKSCGICQAANREQIDTALLGGRSVRSVAKTFGFSKSRVHSHRQRCLGAAIRKASEARQTESGNQLLAQVGQLHKASISILNAALNSGDSIIALQAIRESRANVELLARLVGQIGGTSRAPVVNAVAVKIVYEDARRGDAGGRA
jgi:hypothetical protein